MKTIALIAAVGALALFLPRGRGEEKTVIRFGHFPNITHAQGVIAHALSRQGKGWFEKRLGPNVEIQWFTYNAGPSAMEAIFAGSLDLTYVGQGPALNAYFKSNGEEIRVLADAANGGAALVIKPDGLIKTAADFRGKKIATPQLGNTQDISCRAWLKAQGFKVTQTGGDVMVVPTNNPDLRIDRYRPPPGFVILTCDRLEVLKLKRADGSSSQAMTAYGHVIIEGADFTGNTGVHALACASSTG